MTSSQKPRIEDILGDFGLIIIEAQIAAILGDYSMLEEVGGF